jgi:hypothetical protein
MAMVAEAEERSMCLFKAIGFSRIEEARMIASLQRVG